MPIYRGTQKVTKLYRGSQEVVAAYRGDQQVYSSMPALTRSAPDYWYTLDYTMYPYKSYGSKSRDLTFYSGSFHDRGGHAWVAGAKSHILSPAESWGGKWSTSFWLQKTGSPTNTETLFGRGVNTGPLISIWSNGANELNLDIGVGPVYNYPSTAKVPASGWYHFAATCEVVGGKNFVTVYVNGQVVWEVTPASAQVPYFGPQHFVTFANHPNPSSSYPFDGNIDDIALWSRTLSPGEVSAIYQGGRGIVPPVPTRYDHSESQNNTGIYVQVTSANTWQTLTSGSNLYSVPLQTAGTAQVEWTRMWGDQTYGIRFIVNGVETAYRQIQGRGSANIFMALTIPEQSIPSGATWAIQVRTSDPYNNQNRRIRRASLTLS